MGSFLCYPDPPITFTFECCLSTYKYLQRCCTCLIRHACKGDKRKAYMSHLGFTFAAIETGFNFSSFMFFSQDCEHTEFPLFSAYVYAYHIHRRMNVFQCVYTNPGMWIVKNPGIFDTSSQLLGIAVALLKATKNIDARAVHLQNLNEINGN